MKRLIFTKYFGPTRVRQARIKAYDSSCSIIVPYEYDLSRTIRYLKAAEALIKKLGLTGTLEEVPTPDDKLTAFIFTPED